MHDAWCGWMRYFFSRCEKVQSGVWTGSLVIPHEWRERWQRQMQTPYVNLSDTEKESDREEARKMLAALAPSDGPTERNRSYFVVFMETIRDAVRDGLAAADAALTPEQREKVRKFDEILRLVDGGMEPVAAARKVLAPSDGEAVSRPHPQESCICAAIVTESGEVIRGHRHMDCLRTAGERGLKQKPGHEYQGFVTSRNRYVNREEAARLQIAAGIESADKEHPYLHGECYSEDLYLADNDPVAAALAADDQK